MSEVVDRQVIENGGDGKPRPLSEYRDRAAYVLLGDPGAGKTTAFAQEARSQGGHRVTAGDFLALSLHEHPEWKREPLLIDGLDEVRAGGCNPRPPLNGIRAGLEKLGKPRFRISCRDADWWGDRDRLKLAALSGDGEIVELRLAPLTVDEQIRVLGGRDGIADARAWLLEAAERGLHGLLGNAQSLDLLARAFGNRSVWPASRRQIFEEAARRLAREPNPEYSMVDPAPRAEKVVDAARRLSAILLLAGAEGYALEDGDEERLERWVPVSLVDPEGDPAVRAALRTRIFSGRFGERRFVPAHSHLAAFLGAQHLAPLVGQGVLPTGRLLSLLEGGDGAPPTPLRGLVGWLAALSPELRPELIWSDPVATLLYGDASDFNQSEKNQLIHEVGRAYAGLHFWPPFAVAALATPDFEEDLRAVLRRPPSSDEERAALLTVLTAIANAAPLPKLTPELLPIVRDEQHPQDIRVSALDGWVHALPEDDKTEQLIAMLNELRDTEPADVARELVGTLLKHVYPGRLRPAEVWSYAAGPGSPSGGRFGRFWSELEERCPNEHLPELLDSLASVIDSLRPVFDAQYRKKLPKHLLARALEAHGETTAPTKLARWLRTGLDEYGAFVDHRTRAPKYEERIRAWLETHPEIRTSVIEEVLDTGFLGENPSYQKLEWLLYESRPPHQNPDQHLQDALAAPGSELTKYYLDRFLRTLADQPTGVDAKLAAAHAGLADRDDCLDFLTRGLKRELPPSHLETQIRLAEWRRFRPPNRLADAVRQHRDEIRANRAPARLLDAVLRGFDGRRPDNAEQVRELVGKTLEGDNDLIETALIGLRGAPGRDDVPSIGELIRLSLEKKMPWVTRPVLAGMLLLTENERHGLSERQWGVSLAMRILHMPSSRDPDWWTAFMARDPDFVAEVIVTVARPLFRAGHAHIDAVYSFPKKEEYQRVAEQASGPLLRSFPVQAKRDVLPLLDCLLASGLKRLPEAVFREILDRKLGSRSMTRSQRTRWLAAGLVLDSNRHLSELQKHIEDAEGEVDNLAWFFTRGSMGSGGNDEALEKRLDAQALAWLIRVVGNGAKPLEPLRATWLGNGAPHLVPRLIGRLAECPEREATQCLEALATKPDLIQWREFLTAAAERQRVLRRDLEHQVPTPQQVIALLSDQGPASAKDLLELLVDRFDRIDREMHRTNANHRQLFWNQDGAGALTEPKPENACRDAVLVLLRPLLPEGCNAQPEPQLAGNRRADLRLTHGTEWGIPIEIKKSYSPDLWRAASAQLLAHYVPDLTSGGLGVYLVLWFGPGRVRRSPSGNRPESPGELRRRLEAQLSRDEQRRVAIRVLDVVGPIQTPDQTVK